MDQRIQRILELMRENLHKDLSLDEFAQSVNLSVGRLCHIFKSETGQSPIRYLMFLRMERAGSLLVTSFLSVKEVAHAVGINDGSKFVRNFKTIYGVTPTRYRMLLNGGVVNESPDPEVIKEHSKIRQRIATVAKRSMLQSRIILIYIVMSLVNAIEILLEVRKSFK